jgi:hypothetical protein
VRLEIERLGFEPADLKPGDRLIVRTQERLSPAAADAIRERLRTLLPLPEGVQVLILDCGMTLDAEQSDDREITR